MSETDTLKTTGYPVVAEVRGQHVLLYEQYGSYQGEWLMFAHDPKKQEYYIYKGWYGSCSGCDDYEASMNYSNVTRESAMEFAKNYPPFIEIPRETAAELAKNRTLLSAFPANVRTESSEVDLERFARDSEAQIKLTEGLEFTPNEIWELPNQELRRRAWESYGVDRFVMDSKMKEIGVDGSDKLVSVESRNEKYLLLKDASTPRRYLLRVPSNMERCRQAKAWTFGLKEEEYNPLLET